MAVLIEIGGARPRTFELGPATLIGRNPQSQICLGDTMVSPKHAEIRLTSEQRYAIVDLGSRHGTLVRGKRVTEALLEDGDEILVGAIRLRFEDAQARAPAVPERLAPELSGPHVRRIVTQAEPRFRPTSEIASAEDLRRDYEKLRAAFELTRSIGVEHDLKVLLERILEVAFQLLKAGRGAVVVLEPESGHILMQHARRRTGERVELSLSTSILNEVVAHKAGIITSDANIDARFNRSGSIYAQGIQSAMCVPMLYRDELQGIMYLDSQHAAAVFDEKDLELFTTVASQAALAIRNAMLVKRVQTVRVEEWRRLERVIAEMPSGVVLLDESRHVVLANRRAEELLGALGVTRDEPLCELGPVSIDQILLQEGPESVEVVVPGPPKRIFAVSATRPQKTSQTETIVLLREVTHEREREERASQQERLATLGQLAGGIAHDFNNLLAVITNYSEFVEAEVTDPALRSDLDQIQQAARRAAELTRQLLLFSRREITKPQVVDLNTLVAGMGKLLGRTLGEHIALRLELASDPWRVKADPTKFEQVLMNLVVNARDAMPGGGTLCIRTQNLDLAGAAGALEGVRPGRTVLVEVSDTGTGMTPEVAGRVFEPFFTTKEKGRGTGLGLATAYGILQQAGGAISVRSEPGKGSTFRVLLPATDERADTEAKAPQAAPRASARETILVAEDEEGVRKLTRRILEQTGYTVLDASNGDEALKLSDDHSGTIHLLLTDVIMPRMSGKQLSAELLKRRPGLRVLYMSGYTDDTFARHEPPDRSAFLPKPFTRDDLLTRVREILGSGRG